MSGVMTLDQFQRALPKSCKNNIDQGVIDGINKLMVSPALKETYRDNLLSYTSVMADGKYRIQGYLDAVRYVSFKLLGASNIEAYTKTFPDRYQRLLNDQVDARGISQFVSHYNKTQLVNKIMEQTLVPTHILNADMYQKALNVQAELMLDARSEKVRCDAANSLLTHLKRPETQKIELDVNIKDDKSIDDLRATTLELVKQQKAMIESNSMSVKQIAHSKLVIEEGVIIE